MYHGHHARPSSKPGLLGSTKAPLPPALSETIPFPAKTVPSFSCLRHFDVPLGQNRLLSRRLAKPGAPLYQPMLFSIAMPALFWALRRCYRVTIHHDFLHAAQIFFSAASVSKAGTKGVSRWPKKGCAAAGTAAFPGERGDGDCKAKVPAVEGCPPQGAFCI